MSVIVKARSLSMPAGKKKKGTVAEDPPCSVI